MPKIVFFGLVTMTTIVMLIMRSMIRAMVMMEMIMMMMDGEINIRTLCQT